MCFNCRVDSATGQVVRRSALVSSIEDGKTAEQENSAFHAADVVREEEDASRVLVQRAQESRRRIVQVYSSMGTATLWGTR